MTPANNASGPSSVGVVIDGGQGQFSFLKLYFRRPRFLVTTSDNRNEPVKRVPLVASGAAAVPFPVGAVMMMEGEPGVLAAAAMHSLVVRLQAAPVSAQLES
jgi:hypothetical protein